MILGRDKFNRIALAILIGGELGEGIDGHIYTALMSDPIFMAGNFLDEYYLTKKVLSEATIIETTGFNTFKLTEKGHLFLNHLKETINEIQK